MRASNYVHVAVHVIRQESDKAFQVVLEDGTIHWLPKSQIANAGDYEAGDRDLTLSITEWIAGEKGIDGEESDD